MVGIMSLTHLITGSAPQYRAVVGSLTIEMEQTNGVLTWYKAVRRISSAIAAVVVTDQGALSCHYPAQFPDLGVVSQILT